MRQKIAQQLLAKVVEDYDNISTEFDQTRHHHWDEFQMLVPQLKDKQSIVDLGCGNGRFYDFLKKHCKPHYLGIDNSSGLLKSARKNHPKAKFVKGDLLDIPVDDQSSDITVCIAAFHHIPSKKLRQKSLDEIHRITRTKGLLFLTVWNLHQPKYRKYVWRSYLRWLLSLGSYDIGDTFIPWGKSGVKRYYHAFTQKEIESLLEKSGFKILKKESGNNHTYLCEKQ